MTSQGYLSLQPASFEIFGCKYVYRYICITPFLPQFHGPQVQALLVAIQNYIPKGKVNTVSSRTLDCR